MFKQALTATALLIALPVIAATPWSNQHQSWVLPLSCVPIPA